MGANSAHRSLARRWTFFDLSNSVHKAITLKFIYLIQSLPYPGQRYVGIISDVAKRLTAHNEGRSPHTSKLKPWKLITYLAFTVLVPGFLPRLYPTNAFLVTEETILVNGQWYSAIQ